MTVERRLQIVGADLPDPPYPESTRAYGWRFEIELERMHQSSTWRLAPPEIRPWLVLLWVESWGLHPCGAYEKDDRVIAATIGMPLAMFQTHREALLSGWYECSDHLLYHPVVTERVLEMIAYRERKAENLKSWRQRNKGDVTGMKPATNRLSTTPVPVPVPVPVPEETKTKSKAISAPSVPPGFQEFWLTWPVNERKVGKAKCLDLWKAKKLEPLAATIAAHVKAWRGSTQWKEFCPQPIKYLKERRWEDGTPPDGIDRNAKPKLSL